MDTGANTFFSSSTDFLNHRKCVFAVSKKAESNLVGRIPFPRVILTTTAYRLASALGLVAKTTT
jgi:hypothetical protein